VEGKGLAHQVDLQADHQEAAVAVEWHQHQHLLRLHHLNHKVLVCKVEAEAVEVSQEFMQLIRERLDLVCTNMSTSGQHGDQDFGHGLPLQVVDRLQDSVGPAIDGSISAWIHAKLVHFIVTKNSRLCAVVFLF
jgi:hypothetical protein